MAQGVGSTSPVGAAPGARARLASLRTKMSTCTHRCVGRFAKHLAAGGPYVMGMAFSIGEMSPSISSKAWRRRKQERDEDCKRRQDERYEDPAMTGGQPKPSLASASLAMRDRRKRKRRRCGGQRA